MNRRISRREWFRGMLGAALGTVATSVAAIAAAAPRPVQPVHLKSARCTYTCDVLTNRVSTTYDFRGRVVSITDPLGRRQTYCYDSPSMICPKPPSSSQMLASSVHRLPLSGCGATGA